MSTIQTHCYLSVKSLSGWLFIIFFLFPAERHLYFYVPLRTWREESNGFFIAKNHLTYQDQVPKRLDKIVFFCILEVYLAIAPAPVNEVVLDSEDTFLSEMSSQRDWPLRTTWAGVTSMHIKADNFCQSAAEVQKRYRCVSQNTGLRV